MSTHQNPTHRLLVIAPESPASERLCAELTAARCSVVLEHDAAGARRALLCEKPHLVVCVRTVGDPGTLRCVRCACDLARRPLLVLAEDVGTLDHDDGAAAAEHHAAVGPDLLGGRDATLALLAHIDPPPPVDDTIGTVSLERLRRRTHSAEARYRALFEHAAESIALLTPDGVILEANAAAAGLVGLAPDELIGRRVEDFAPADVVAVNRAQFDGLVAAGRSEGEATASVLRADGARRLVEFSLARIDAGGVDTVLVTGRDVTEQRAQETRMQAAQRLEAIGLLTGGVAHDFNNVLAAILANAEALLRALPDADPLREQVLEIVASSERGAAMTRQLLAFAGRQPRAPRMVDLGAATRGVEAMIRRLLGDRVILNTVIPDGVGCAVVDQGQFEQVLVNLAVNARDAMPRGGTLTVSLYPTELDGTAAADRGLQAGPFVRLQVSDTGVGIDPAVLPRIFEPFFTTKPADRGTGLGLATSLGIIRQSGGSLEVESTPGQGTTFTIHLPRAVGTSAAPPHRAADGPVGRGTETVLLVEDEPHLRAALTRTLTGLGYGVVGSPGGQDAVALAASRRDDIAAIISDVDLPGERGPELVGRLQQALGARVPVLWMSAHFDPGVTPTIDAATPADFLQKPFSGAALGERLRTLIG